MENKNYITVVGVGGGGGVSRKIIRQRFDLESKTILNSKKFCRAQQLIQKIEGCR